MSNLKSPSCNLCNKVFQTLEVLNVHMKTVHKESDNDRIERLALTIGSALAQDSNLIKTSQDCTECGLIFNTSQEKKNHDNKDHTNTVPPSEISIKSTEKKSPDILSKTL